MKSKQSVNWLSHKPNNKSKFAWFSVPNNDNLVKKHSLPKIDVSQNEHEIFINNQNRKVYVKSLLLPLRASLNLKKRSVKSELWTQ